MSEPVFLDALLIVMGTVAFVASLNFLRRFLESRGQRRQQVDLDGLQERLARIESVVESTALEVERIAESNRFVAKLLSERAGAVIVASPPAS
jgi:hypothetical protein